MARKPLPTTGELLLRTVFERPEDDAPRLIYADWLEESGTDLERAALIRVQCELARLPPSDPRAEELKQAEARLFRGRKLKWRAHLPKLRGVVWGPFSRGFVDSVTMRSTYPFRRFAARIAEVIPLHSVTVKPTDDFPRQFTGFGQKPALATLCELHLTGQRMTEIEFAQLLNSPFLDRLGVLDLADNCLGDPGARRLYSSGALAGLRVLILRNNRIGADGAKLLAAWPHAARLERLDLSDNPIPPAAQNTLRLAVGDRVRL